TRLDDSVLFVSGNHPQLVRRARGFAPNPIQLVDDGPSVLACGPELKNTFCLTREKYAFMSQHLGDMQNLETWYSFEESLELYKHIFHTEPSVAAYDMHPNYMTTRYGLAQTNLRQVAVQHHHSHLAACLADNKHSGPAIGVIFDGTGYGLDGTIWGGEFLVGDASGFVRAGYLQPLPLPGGEAAIHKPYRTAWAYWRTLLAETPLPAALKIPPEESDLLGTMLAHHVNTPLTSSAGRLFDAVSALLGVCGITSYEAQAAIELEATARQAAASDESFPFCVAAFNHLQQWGKAPVEVETGYMVNLAPLLQELGASIAHDTTSALAYRFHTTIAQMIASVCHKLSANTGIKLAALSGGCFQNKLLLELTIQALQEQNLDVLCHTQVPCNDGGLSLGQAVIARTMIRS
ncbi:MAG: Kae1-like domain-containing protein, partial [Anaerolineae bacterium]